MPSAAVAVTHLHGDHFGGLPFLILDGQFSHRSAPLLVAGPPGIGARLAEAMETLFPGSTHARRQFPVQVTELAPGGTPAELGAALVRGWQAGHACGAPPLALRADLGGVRFGGPVAGYPPDQHLEWVRVRLAHVSSLPKIQGNWIGT